MEKSRAIELLEHLAWDRDIDRNPYGDALNIAIDALKAQLSCEGTTSDMISKTETVERLRGAIETTVPITDYDGGYIDGIESGISTVSTMPTIQPFATDTNVCDTISRQAARHALCKAVHKGEDIPCENQTASCLWTGTRVCDYVREIDALPPIQPERAEGEWIRTDCGLDVECKCSVCGYRDFVSPHDTYWFNRNFCPNCGAKMKGKRQK